jgi:hypothetical protein
VGGPAKGNISAGPEALPAIMLLANALVLFREWRVDGASLFAQNPLAGLDDHS